MRKGAKLDRIDAEAIREVLQMRGFKLIQLRLRQLHSKNLAALISQQTEVETATLRGRIEGLSQALSIPDTLIREGRPGSEED